MHDLLVIGGGVNGTAIARDAAGRGRSVLLCERDDLASHTSSASTKLIHGGLRYLEQYEFRLVREALREREVMLRTAPHVVWPMRFVLPHEAGMRPKWMLRMGLFLYDHIGGNRTLPGTETVALGEPPFAGTLDPGLTTGFAYSDCWVEDARLVVLNAVDAAERGADVRTRCAVESLRAEDGVWVAELSDGTTVRARQVANAAGAWVERVLDGAGGREAGASLRLVRGSHIVTRRLFEGEHAFIFQNDDGRVIFAIPYEQDFTLIGTTDVPTDDPHAKASEEEIAYLCAAASDDLAVTLTPDDVVSTYSGVRPLYDDQAADASAVTRDYVLKVRDEGGARMLSVYGGKITTARKLAEHAVEKLGIGGAAWTEEAALPGGDFGEGGSAALAAHVARDEGIDPAHALRLVRAYGTRARGLGAGETVAPGVARAEIAYLCEREWAREAEDVLWRRSKLGLHLSEAEQRAVAEAVAALTRRAASPVSAA